MKWYEGIETRKSYVSKLRIFKFAHLIKVESCGKTFEPHQNATECGSTV